MKNMILQRRQNKKSNNFTVTAEILDIDIHKDSGILYTISVTASENTDVQAGSEIKIFSSALTTGGRDSTRKVTILSIHTR